MGVTQRYQRVPTGEEEEKRNVRKRRAEAAELIATKIQAVVWVVVGGFVVYHTNMPYVLLQDPSVHRFWLNIAAATFAINAVLCSYLTLWLPYVARIDIEWNIYCPRIIPTMTAVGLICAFSYV
uniref:Uncharacterized protein n=1 Tax=Aureoumbra lagunensis TaxID=44058 RepID=A0A7S3JQB4_9STRA